MHLKRYTLASILLIAVVSFYVYKMVTPGTYTLDLLGINISLPVAVWSVVPMTLLFLASFIHILYYGIKDYFRRKRVSKDLDKLADALYWDILKEPKKHNYTDKEIRKIGLVLDMGCENFLKSDKRKCNEHIRDAIDIVTAIKHGEFMDIKKLNLDKSNPYEIQNWLNLLKNEPIKAEEILRKYESFNKRVVKEATKIFVESANGQQLERFAHFIDNDIMMHLLDTMASRSEKDRISLEVIEKILMQKNSLDCDYLLLAKKLSKLYTPHALLSFFEKITTKDERAFKGYIFILIEFEMLDKANELLEDTQHDEYLDFKAFLDLRKAGKHYPLDIFLKL